MGNKTPHQRKINEWKPKKQKNPEETGLKTGAFSGVCEYV